MTLKYNNKTIIEHTINNMLEICARVILVGGYKIENLKPIAARYAQVELVCNENHLEGMFSSVLQGLLYIRTDRFFVTPGDYPLIEPQVYRELLKQPGKIVIPTYRGRRGHPVLLDRIARNELLMGHGYQSLRDYIVANHPIFVPVACKGILIDIDTQEDYQALQSGAYIRGREDGS